MDEATDADRVDWRGLRLRDRDVSGLRLVDCYADVVEVGGSFGAVIVNDVDVTAFVEAELDRIEPGRVLARTATSPDRMREAWRFIAGRWAATIDAVATWPEPLLHERVEGEWSFVESLRHLLHASDRWMGESAFAEPHPYHRLGIPAGGTSPELVAELGLRVDESATLAEVLRARGARAVTVGRFLESATVQDLDAACVRVPPWLDPDVPLTVGRCVRVVLKEEAEHHRYAVRDLARLAARTGG